TPPSARSPCPSAIASPEYDRPPNKPLSTALSRTASRAFRSRRVSRKSPSSPTRRLRQSPSTAPRSSLRSKDEGTCSGWRSRKNSRTFPSPFHDRRQAPRTARARRSGRRQEVPSEERRNGQALRPRAYRAPRRPGHLRRGRAVGERDGI